MRILLSIDLLCFYRKEYVISRNQSYKNRRKKQSSRRCAICNIDGHRASYAKQLRRKNQLENIRQVENVTPEWLFKEEQTPIKKTIKKYTSLNH